MRWFLRIFFTLVLLAGWIGLGLLYVDFTLGSSKRSQPVQVQIPPQTSLQGIGRILEEKGLIRESYFFRYYVIWKQKTNLRAGNYEIAPGETLDQMLDRFAEGKENTVRIDVIPGFTAYDIADRLTKNGLDGQGFLKALNNKTPKFAFEKQIPNHPQRPYKLEGYLYPDTYYFPKKEKPENIVNAMLERFNKQLVELKIQEQLQQDSPLNGNKPMTLDQLVTVASLIQREGQVKSEKPIIAGVIYNRLQKNKKLQVDATIVFMYRMKGQKIKTVLERMYYEKHPYSTYAITGLPPGPISSPTKVELEAALHPQKHRYLFYVTRDDGSNLHYFAENDQGHKANLRKREQNRQRAQASRQ
ncbi:endolytic transglycosylase MltG [Laceyella putida]|uniref:Endolytic murein transglycosylase n=1 Tax=Laceyella putida TaxID=110101 RepID=A0ABW2RK66_9BACL